uniref:Uncharacterized protein n=1 Tax=Anguilla anguilla TaxID=7936 RepID=A0A0E9Q563_ANGAN
MFFWDLHKLLLHPWRNSGRPDTPGKIQHCGLVEYQSPRNGNPFHTGILFFLLSSVIFL